VNCDVLAPAKLKLHVEWKKDRRLSLAAQHRGVLVSRKVIN